MCGGLNRQPALHQDGADRNTANDHQECSQAISNPDRERSGINRRRMNVVHRSRHLPLTLTTNDNFYSLQCIARMLLRREVGVNSW